MCTNCNGEGCFELWATDLAAQPRCRVSNPSQHGGKTPYVMMTRENPWLPPDYYVMHYLGWPLAAIFGMIAAPLLCKVG